MRTQTFMKQEIREIPEVLEFMFSNAAKDIKKISNHLKEKNISYFTTIARGSSDHAASYLKYVIEIIAGFPVASIGPSISSIYGTSLNLNNVGCISISQSGQSPDILSATAMAKANGASTISITNDRNSQLAKNCDFSIDISARTERSVAATKTFVSSIASGLLLVAIWKNDKKLLNALYSLPEKAKKAIECDWGELRNILLNRNSLYTIGRGPSWAISNEAALKFKETCQVHAESYSSAEVMHGPKSIIGQDFPIVAFASRDAAEASMVDAVNLLSNQGARCFITSDAKCKGTRLPFVKSGHPLTDPLLLIISFYQCVEELARERGLNPDEPPHLLKVTETV